MRPIAFLLMTSLSLSGCATIFTGTTQVVTVHTKPLGALVEVDGVESGRTPVDITIKRGGLHTISLSKEGYHTETVWLGRKMNLWVVLSLLAGFIPGLIDLWTGAAFWSSQDVVRVALRETHTNKERE